MANELITDTTRISSTQTYYDRLLLTRAEPFLIHTLFAQDRNLPKNQGTKIIQFRRYTNLSAATTALTEGTTPSNEAIAVTNITATVAQYGSYVIITDMVDLTTPDKTVTNMTELLGDQMGLTIDTLTRDILVAGATVKLATGGEHYSAGSTPGYLQLADVTSVQQTLISANARPIGSIIKASTGVGTKAVSPAFYAMAHTDLLTEIPGFTGWQKVADYADPSKALEAEYGAIDRIRFLFTTNATKTGSGTDGTPYQYQTPVVAKDAYGVTRLAGGEKKVIVKSYGSSGTADPLDQRSTVGWKTAFVAKILNDNFMVVLKSCHYHAD